MTAKNDRPSESEIFLFYFHSTLLFNEPAEAALLSHRGERVNHSLPSLHFKSYPLVRWNLSSCILSCTQQFS